MKTLEEILNEAASIKGAVDKLITELEEFGLQFPYSFQDEDKEKKEPGVH